MGLKIEEKVTLIDTLNNIVEDYVEGFKEFCEVNEYVVRGKGTDMEGLYLGGKITFYDWYNREVSRETQEFWDNVKFYWEHTSYTYKAIVTGVLGLWNGQYTIYPKIFDNLYDAMSACAKDAYDIAVKVENNVVTFENHHHDGTNVFEIRIINSKTDEKIEWWDDDIDGDYDVFCDFIKKNYVELYWEFFGL